jgi:hypothetical protein
MQLYARQGDLVFNKLSGPVPGELKPVTGLVLSGRDSGPHTVVGLVGHRRDGRTLFLSVGEPTEVTHAGRHKAITLEPGSYEVYPLRERGGVEDRAVED